MASILKADSLGGFQVGKDVKIADEFGANRYSKFLSRRGTRLRPSAIRTLVPLFKIPGIISFAGGLPNPSVQPIKGLTFDIMDLDGNILPLRVPESELAVATQYSENKGLPALVDELKDFQSKEHDPQYSHWDLCMTSGASDGVARIMEILLDEEDCLLVEEITYSGSLSQIHGIGCKVIGIKSDSEGVIPESLEDCLANWSHPRPPKAIYVIPTGQNPTGTTWSPRRREEVYAICVKYDILILEDDPYWYLRYDEHDNLKSFFGIDTHGLVIRFDSASKVFSAGMRLGWTTGPSYLIQLLLWDMMASHLHTSGVTQAIFLTLLRYWGREGWNKHVARVKEFYQNRRNAFLSAAEKYLTGLCEWNSPTAGMFVWFKLKDIEDSNTWLVKEKINEIKVLFVPGEGFYPNTQKSSYLRASFSVCSDELIEEGLQRLAHGLQTHLKH